MRYAASEKLEISKAAETAARASSHWTEAANYPRSRFAIVSDSRSYERVRQLVMDAGVLPPRSEVRIEELINNAGGQFAAPAAEMSVAAWKKVIEKRKEKG